MRLKFDMLSEFIEGHIDIVDFAEGGNLNVTGWISELRNENFAIIVNEDYIKVGSRVSRPDVNLHLSAEGDFGWFLDLEINKGEVDEPIRIKLVLFSQGREVILDVKEVRLPENKWLTKPSGTLLKSQSVCGVVVWDIAHNPAGRAYVLVKILETMFERVVLIGPAHPRFGTEVWEPISADPNLNIRTRVCESVDDLELFITDLKDLSLEWVWICKPRFPSMYLGLRLSEECHSKVILDNDDYELGFFPKKSHANLDALKLSEIINGKFSTIDIEATCYAHSVLPDFERRSVSNVQLQSMFGGEIITHSRAPADLEVINEHAEQKRKELGILKDDFVVSFIGTIRPHKGVLEIARAVAEIPNSRFLCGGVFDPLSIKSQIKDICGDKAVFVDGVNFKNIEHYLACSDAICVPQNFESESSYFQLPSKISDALRLGKPVIVNDLPPYSDFKDQSGIVVRKKDESLTSALVRCAKKYEKNNAEQLAIVSTFHRYFSLSQGVSIARTLLEKDVTFDEGKAFESFFGRKRKHKISRVVRPNYPDNRKAVLFWKQNDAGIFGRRVDMLAKYMLLAKTVDQILILEPPLTKGHIQNLERLNAHETLTSNGLLLKNIYYKCNKSNFADSSLVYSPVIVGKLGEKILDVSAVPAGSAKQQYIQIIKDLGFDQNSVAILFPHCPYALDIVRDIDFNNVIMDVVDDQRNFEVDPEKIQAIESNYLDCSSVSDVVMTNNVRNVSEFRKLLSREIELIPNAGDNLFDDQNVLRVEGLRGSDFVVGYIGNMRDRFDSELIREIAQSRKAIDNGWKFVLVGPTGGNEKVERLNSLSNVHFTGPLDAVTARQLARSFNIALVPHIVEDLSESMDPLKMYLYRSVGLPVVSTRIATSVQDEAITFASDAREFCEVIFKLQKGFGLPKQAHKLPKQSSWSERIEKLNTLIYGAR